MSKEKKIPQPESVKKPEVDKETKKQLEAIEKTVYRIEQDTIKIRKELKEHIEEIWAVYKPLKKILKIFKKDE